MLCAIVCLRLRARRLYDSPLANGAQFNRWESSWSINCAGIVRLGDKVMSSELELKPYAVPIRIAQTLLGNKARSEIYGAINRGELEARKDGKKTLITMASIERRQTSLPPADFKRYPHIRRRGRKARKAAS
jgi:hypothetical protein